MGAFVYAVPSLPVPSTGFVRSGLVSRWTGWDGSTWDLTDTADGVFLARGVRGLNMGPHDQFTDVSPALAGSRFLDFRATERSVFWPLAIFEDTSSQAWLERDAAFWRTMRPGQTGVWRVQGPSGSSRDLTLRFVGDGDHAYELDPVGSGWAIYGLYLVAHDPFWRGRPIERTWRSSSSVDFFDAGGSPSFHISDGSTIDSAQIVNPGDVDEWVTWAINGATTDAELGVNGSVIEVPITVADGERLVVLTAPDAQVALLGEADPSDPFGVIDGEDVTADLGEAEFSPVPADAITDLSITMTGTGTVSARMVPGYWRAW